MSKKIEMRLICPNCGTFLKLSNGHNQNPQNCVDPHEFCPKKGCDFVIFYEQKEPDCSGPIDDDINDVLDGLVYSMMPK